MFASLGGRFDDIESRGTCGVSHIKNIDTNYPNLEQLSHTSESPQTYGGPVGRGVLTRPLCPGEEKDV